MTEYSVPGPKRQLTGLSLGVTIGTEDVAVGVIVEVSVGKGVNVAVGVEGGCVSVGGMGVAVGSVPGKLQDAIIEDMSKSVRKERTFMVTSLLILESGWIKKSTPRPGNPKFLNLKTKHDGVCYKPRRVSLFYVALKTST